MHYTISSGTERKISYSLNRTEAIEHSRSMVLAQVASYRYLVDAANKEEKLAEQASEIMLVAIVIRLSGLR